MLTEADRAALAELDSRVVERPGRHRAAARAVAARGRDLFPARQEPCGFAARSGRPLSPRQWCQPRALELAGGSVRTRPPAIPRTDGQLSLRLRRHRANHEAYAENRTVVAASAIRRLVRAPASGSWCRSANNLSSRRSPAGSPRCARRAAGQGRSEAIGAPSMTIGVRTPGIVPLRGASLLSCMPQAPVFDLRIGKHLRQRVDRPGRNLHGLELVEQIVALHARGSGAELRDQLVAVRRAGPCW